MLFELGGLRRDSTCVLEAKAGKLHILRRETIYQFTSWFTLQIIAIMT